MKSHILLRGALWLGAIIVCVVCTSCGTSPAQGSATRTTSSSSIKADDIKIIPPKTPTDPLTITVPKGVDPKSISVHVETVQPKPLKTPATLVRFVKPSKGVHLDALARQWPTSRVISFHPRGQTRSPESWELSLPEFFLGFEKASKQGMVDLDLGHLGPIYLIHERYGKERRLQGMFFTTTQGASRDKTTLFIIATPAGDDLFMGGLDILVPRDRPLTRQEREKVLQAIAKQNPPDAGYVREVELCVTLESVQMDEKHPIELKGFADFTPDLTKGIPEKNGMVMYNAGWLTRFYPYVSGEEAVYAEYPPSCWKK